MTLSCNATGNPKPAISWTRNGSRVDASNNSRISFSENKHQLTITNVNRTDSGEYQCVASNSVGNATSDVALLDVQCKYGFLETLIKFQCFFLRLDAGDGGYSI